MARDNPLRLRNVVILYGLSTSETNIISNDATLYATAEKVRSLIETSRLDIDGTSLTVTASIGATLLYSNDSPDSLIRRADSLMYRSKRTGGNLVTVG